MEHSARGLTLKRPSPLSLLELPSYMETIGSSLTWVSRHDILFIHPLSHHPFIFFASASGRSWGCLKDSSLRPKALGQSSKTLLPPIYPPCPTCQVLQ